MTNVIPFPNKDKEILHKVIVASAHNDHMRGVDIRSSFSNTYHLMLKYNQKYGYLESTEIK